MLRTDDRRAVVLLCPLVHELHVANSDRLPFKTIHSRKYPTVDARHLLWAKKHFDPEYYDEDYLESIWKLRLPDPEPPPSYWIESLLVHQGITLD